ncbi:MAG: hypothetical protein K2L05_03135 [Muribaculaceae bacterium]|nr:hypothetical protein [Muribaculaceae bacterium]
MKKKKFFGMVAVAALTLTAASCSNDGPLTASSAKKAIEKEAFFQKNTLADEFKTGYYESSESNLDKLAQLQAAGMINYSTDEVTEYVTSRQWVGGWYGSYQNVTREIKHWFVNVSLTEAGAKLVVDEPDMKRKDILKDLKANKDYAEIIPDYMTVGHKGAKPVAAPAVEEAEEVVVEEVADTVEEIVEMAEAVEETPAPAPANKNAAYEAALGRVNSEEVYVLMCQFKVVKCKEVFCPEEMKEAGKGQCSFVWKVTDKTPFGYVLMSSQIPGEGYLNTGSAEFVFYNDLGWTVSKLDLND